MSVDNGVGVAVMSAQKMPAAKMGHTPCYQTNGKTRFQRQGSTCPIGARYKQDRIKRRPATIAHVSCIFDPLFGDPHCLTLTKLVMPWLGFLHLRHKRITDFALLSFASGSTCPYGNPVSGGFDRPSGLATNGS